MNISLLILKQCTLTPSPIGLILQFKTQIKITMHIEQLKIFNSHTCDMATQRTLLLNRVAIKPITHDQTVLSPTN